jgi:hypothetical protein
MVVKGQIYVCPNGRDPIQSRAFDGRSAKRHSAERPDPLRYGFFDVHTKRLQD